MSVATGSLAYHLAQLRHAYAHLNRQGVRDQRRFADGLIAPVIRYLEANHGEA